MTRLVVTLMLVSTLGLELPGAVAQDVPPDAQPTKKSQSQRALTKIRPGSVLGAHDAVVPKPPDLRGELERYRDNEITKHYSRMAELDVIAELAEKSHEVALLEEVEEVRRKEVQRFRQAMQQLRQRSRRRVPTGEP